MVGVGARNLASRREANGGSKLHRGGASIHASTRDFVSARPRARTLRDRLFRASAALVCDRRAGWRGPPARRDHGVSRRGKSMKRPYLEVTFRKGKPIAAYLYLPRPTGAKAIRTVEIRPNLLIDYSATGDPIGI